MNSTYFKHAELSPEVVLAGDSVEFTIKLVTGKGFSADHTRLIFDMPGYLGMSRPTNYHQELPGFVEVFCSNPDIYYKKRIWDIEVDDFTTSGKSGFKGMAQRLFVLDFEKGAPEKGDEIEVKWGYVCSGYSCGTGIATIVPLKEFHNHIYIRYFMDGTKGLPDFSRAFKGYERPCPEEEIKLSFRILPREPDHLRVIRRQNKASILVQDRFWNISPVEDLSEFIHEKPEVLPNAHGVYETTEPGVGITSKSLPLYDAPGMTGVYKGYNIYFGDLHSHSMFSNDCIERERLEMSPDMCFDFAKEVACLDFFAVSDHHQPWDIERNKIGKDQWEKLLQAVKKHNKPGEFIAFPAFEFRCERGDTTVVFNENLSYDEMDDPDIKNIKKLWEKYKGRDYITIPHFHNPGKLPEGEWYACPYEGVESALEIFSCHASYERDDVLERHIAEIKSFRCDRHGKYFLQNGYKYGYICNSDGHKGNPGMNGLTAVYARKLTAEAILDAIRSRRVYGTTNARIRLLFTINDSLMGSVLPNTKEKNIHVEVQGERPFKAVDIFKDGELFRRFKPYSIEFAADIKIEDERASNWYVRATQTDNHIAYSSPIWFEVL